MKRNWPGELLLILAVGAASAWAATPPPLPAEHLTIVTVGPKSPHWIYVLDYAYDNEIDSRVWLFDGDAHRRIGQIDTGFIPGISISPDGRTTAVATT